MALISLWAWVSVSLSMRSSSGSAGAPSSCASAAFQHMMHFSWPMSTPYLYQRAASTVSCSTPLAPYS